MQTKAQELRDAYNEQRVEAMHNGINFPTFEDWLAFNIQVAKLFEKAAKS